MDHSGMDHAAWTTRSDHAQGIEWEDDMVEVNRQTTSATMHWRFLTGPRRRQPPIDWRFTVGDRSRSG
jgi:hypothetical protein